MYGLQNELLASRLPRLVKPNLQLKGEPNKLASYNKDSSLGLPQPLM